MTLDDYLAKYGEPLLALSMRSGFRLHAALFASAYGVPAFRAGDAGPSLKE